MYKFTKPIYKADKELGLIKLKSEKWSIALKGHKGHIHVTVSGPNGYKRQSITDVKADLTPFESRVAALHFWRVAREWRSFAPITKALNSTNYAEIFGSCFD